jgi:hypothetical protein
MVLLAYSPLVRNNDTIQITHVWDTLKVNLTEEYERKVTEAPTTQPFFY